VEGDAERLARATAIRARAGLEPMDASPEVKSVPPLEFPEPPDAEPSFSFEPGERPEEPDDSIRFEPRPPAEPPDDAVRFERGPEPEPQEGAVRFESIGSLGVELEVDPFAPPMPGFALDSEPEPMVEFDSDPSEAHPTEPTAAEPSAQPPVASVEEEEKTGPIRFDETAVDAPAMAEEGTGPIRFEETAVDAPASDEETGPIRFEGLGTDRVGAARQALMASWDAPPREQGALRRELGLALAAAGQLEDAIGALLGANAADASDLETLQALARLHEEAGKPLEAIAWDERAADLLAAGPERAVRLAELARKAEGLGDRDRAVWLWERVRAADHRYRSALEALCRLYAASGDRAQLRLVAAELSDVAGDGALEPWSAALGRSWMDAGKPEVAYAWLQRALRADPSDLTIARDLSRIAERIGSWGEYVRLGEVCADAFAAYDPLVASARFRHFAEVLRDRLSDTERAAVMLEKALSLTPDDADGRRDLLGLWSARPETAQRALDGWIDTVRLDPADGPALVSLAETCRAVARDLSPGADALLLERARIASSMAAFINPALATAPPLKLASGIPDELRERVAVPGATGTLARLLSLLGPYLEPLFPADLSRRGATPSDRLLPPRAPELRAALESAARTFSARPHGVFLASRPGAELAIENTQPPSIIAGAETAGLPESSLAFLAARTFDLLSRGWALAGKFAPKDVGILVELACRYIGAPVPVMGLPAQRADAFLAALARTVPPSVRERALLLVTSAEEEIATFEPRRFTAALRRTANRVALLYTGDPGAALRALAAGERRMGQAEFDPVEAISHPDLHDLALFALSDPYVELRVSVTS
jgi:tetratricopeptide (TPR) repeat protein